MNVIPSRVFRTGLHSCQRGGFPAARCRPTFRHKHEQYTNSSVGTSSWLPLGTGSIVGIFTVHSGLAGSVIAIPMLHNFSKLSAQVITGTVLCATTVSALSGSTAYWLHGATDVKLALTMGIPGAVTAIAGSYLNKRVQGGHLTKVIAAALLLIAPGIALRERKSVTRTSESIENVAEGASITQSHTAPTLAEFFQDNWHLMLAGAGAGFSQGFIGVGGGLLITSLLSLATTIPQHCIIGSTLGSSAIMNMSATVVHYKLGNVNLRVAALISVAATATAFVASHLALQIEEGVLRKGLACGLVVSSLAMLK